MCFRSALFILEIEFMNATRARIGIRRRVSSTRRELE